MRRHLVIFAKVPRLGRVKSRLAAGIGWVAATRFHRQTTLALLRQVGVDPRWQTHLALSPDRAARGRRPFASSAERHPQGSGDLGRRMARPMLGLPPGPVVIVGSDIPAIRAHHVAAAFARLGRCDYVFGPAGDGGYWLVGARRRPRGLTRVIAGLFACVRWSTEHALADTLASLPRGATVGMVATLDDVDDAEGYRRAEVRRFGA